MDNVDWAEVVSNLSIGRADNYVDWVNVGMALSSLENGLELWLKFSQKSSKFNENVCVNKWNSFKSDGKLSCGSLIYWAREDNHSFTIPYLNGTSGTWKPLSNDEKREIEEKRAKWEKKQQQEKQKKVNLLRDNQPHLEYHNRLMDGYHADQLEYFMERWGFSVETIDQFQFGYCSECPTSSYSDSFTIPYFWYDNPINLRHRLLRPNGQGKYRPEMVGLNNAIFNANLLKDEQEMIVMVEGEFKTAQLIQQGISAVGIPGANGYKKEWNRLFTKVKQLYIALDPGADRQAWDIAHTLQSVTSIKVASFPVKPDDFFVKYGGSVVDFYSYLQMAKPV